MYSGGWLLLCGIFSLSETPAWLGNIAYGSGLVFWMIGLGTRETPTRRRKRIVQFITLTLFVGAILLGLSTLRNLEIPISYRYTSHKGWEQEVLHLRPGYYCWIGSFVIAGVVTIFALLERGAEQDQQADEPEDDIFEEY